MKILSRLFKIKILVWIIVNSVFIKFLKHRINIRKLVGLYSSLKFRKKNIPPVWYNIWATRILKTAGEPNCLEKSVILYYLLNKYCDTKFEMRIGVSNNNKLSGHSWIEYKSSKIFDTIANSSEK
ncbi:MAG TPA: lasso peptide biosynthesis B2 protein, partial [bacterium]|nr:lasso peptide biosynthesis B2 protein [bacterium]